MDFVKKRKEKSRILLVEDNPGDVRLTKEALKESQEEIILDVVSDGEEALDFLFKRNQHVNAVLPHIILLDLNLPRKNGIDVLKEVKTHDTLKKIPVIVLTTSNAHHDITKAYSSHANCYILKPVDFDDFANVIKLVETYWFNAVQLPTE